MVRWPLAAMLLVAVPPSLALASEATLKFDEAVRFDDEGDAKSAFAAYRRAAEGGLPNAEFNVAVMLDSGRGVERDLAQAATWYARAASHGHARAAYNLGQLYEAGQGVPVNGDLARAWFEASRLPAARGRVAAATSRVSAGAQTSAPVPVAPGDRGTVDGTEGVELVWVLSQQAEPVRFFIEVRDVTASGSHELFSGFTETSSAFVTIPAMKGDYAWRVSVVAPKASRYVPSGWSRFSVGRGQ